MRKLCSKRVSVRATKRRAMLAGDVTVTISNGDLVIDRRRK